MVFLRDRAVLLSLIGTAVAMAGTFSIISNLSSFVQFNLGYPRDRLGLLYMAGGTVSFFSMRLAGWCVDRFGSFRVVAAGTLVTVLVVGFAFLPAAPLLPVLAIFVGFMLANSTRLVALNSLTTKVPPPADRARFMSLQSAVQHLSTSAGGGLRRAAWLIPVSRCRRCTMNGSGSRGSSASLSLAVASGEVEADWRPRQRDAGRQRVLLERAHALRVHARSDRHQSDQYLQQRRARQVRLATSREASYDEPRWIPGVVSRAAGTTPRAHPRNLDQSIGLGLEARRRLRRWIHQRRFGSTRFAVLALG